MSLSVASSTTTPSKINWSEQPQMRRLDAHETNMRSLQLLKDGTLASLSWDGEIKLWDRKDAGTIFHTFQVGVHHLVEREDGTLATETERAVHVWDRKGQCLAFYEGGHGHYTRVYPSKDAPSPVEQGFPDNTFNGYAEGLKLRDGSRAYGEDDGPMLLRSAQGDWLYPLYGHRRKVTALMQRADGVLVSGGEDGEMNEWDVEGWISAHKGFTPPFYLRSVPTDRKNSFCTRTIKAHTAAIRTLVELKKEAAIASGSYDRTIKVWQDGACVRILENTRAVFKLFALRDGTLVSLFYREPDGEHNQMKLWDNQGKCLNTVMVKDETIEEVLEGKEGTLVGRIQFSEKPFFDGPYSGKIQFWTFPSAQSLG